MITTDLDRYEFTQASSENFKVFRSAGTDIPVKKAEHINVYVTTTGTFTVDINDNHLDDTSHGHAVNEQITLSAATTMPTGLFANTIYYVVNPTLNSSNSFQVALTESGTPVTFSTTGSGTLTWSKTTLKTLNTDYTVSLSGTTATITWESGKRPADGEKVLFLRNVPFQQNTDLKNNSLFEAESVETQLDLIVNMTQQLKNTTARNLRFSDLLVATDAEDASATLTATKDGRKNKSLKFDSIGNLGVSSIDVDKAEDYVLESKSYATETGAVVNTYDGGQASTTSDYSSKEWATGTTATSAKDYATKVDGAVTGTDYSAKAWSVGGTGVTTTSSRGSAKDWATKSDGAVDTSEFSAKAYASVTGSNAPTDGTSKEWATHTGSAIASSEFSAKEYAQGTAATGGTAKEWAQDTSAAVDTTFSAKEYAQGTQSGTGGSAKNWATQTGADVTGASSGDMSSKEWAVGTLGRGVASEGSAKDWATYTAGTVDNAGYSAKYHATDASNSATAAKNSAAAVSNTFDKFDDTYLGKMADNPTISANASTDVITSNAHGLVDTQIIRFAGSDLPAGLSASTNYYVRDKTTNTFKVAASSGGTAIDITDPGSGTTWYHGDVTTPTSSSWAKNSSTITVASNVGIIVGQVVSGSGIPTSPKPNVVSIDGTSIVISENMSAAGSSVAVTFASRGVYGQYNTTTKGPTTNNDGDALETGTLFFSSTANEMRILDSGSNWIAATSAGDVSLIEYKFVTTSAQVTSKTYSGTADVGGTLSYTADNIIVFMNGVQLKNGVDYTASNGSSIVLTTAGQLNDEINVLAFKSFTLSDMVSKSSGGTFSGNVTFGGTVTMQSANNQGFAAGTKMLFQQTSAPTGWTKVTSSNDVALRVVSGSVGSGGSVAFETAFASQTIPVHTLTTSELPSHEHEVTGRSEFSGGDGNVVVSIARVGGSTSNMTTSGASGTTAVGGGGSHGHGSIDLDVQYVDVIIATKD